MIRAVVYRKEGKWRLEVEGPSYEVRELLDTLEKHPFRLDCHGGAWPLETMRATFVPRKKYKREKRKGRGQK